MVDNANKQDNQKKVKGLDKKKLGLGIAVGVLVVGLGGFVLSSLGDSDEPSRGDTTVIDDFENLEDYLVDTYSDKENVEDFTYFTHNATEDELMFLDFSDEDVTVPDYEEGSYAGTIEFSETSNFYAFDVDVEGVEFPITDTVTKRVLIPTLDSDAYSDDFKSVFYDGDDLSVNTSYFTGDIDYALIQVLVPDLQVYTHVRYVQPNTYAYLLAEDFTKESESEGFVVSRDYYEIGGQLYLRYELIDHNSNEDEVIDTGDDVIIEDADPEDLIGQPVEEDPEETEQVEDEEDEEDIDETEESEE